MYLSNYGTPVVDLLTVKPLLDSTISIPNTKSMTIDIKYCFTSTRYCEYMKLKLIDLTDYGVNQ